MGEYIKREDALQRFTFEHGERIPEVDIDNFPITVTIKDIKHILRELPSADVTEVKHGKWIYEERENSLLFWLNCSVCGWKSLDQSVGIVYHYCPNCGAKMGLEDQL